MRQSLPAGVPEIPVKDTKIAIEYYRDKLGFRIDWFEESIDLAGVSRADCRLFIAGESFRSEYRNSAPVVIWLNLDGTERVDSIYHEWKMTGAKLHAAPELKPWGLHEFTMEDPDGNFFRVFYDVQTGGEPGDFLE